ncbi:putative rRNA-processing protein fcf2 protein [Rosellinia necatrix]|uniref:Putative rRNA-processing protein fcf2 protein n=1 Tax=Rosellinia necatrix TaxID=77044 RepID=A0A1W2TMS5_ROSNE|nr:putative rRNA-processing protein fcf2 protein [Rosellinia necatrix]
MADSTVGLSDAQIDELLNQAEVRLREKQQAQQKHGAPTLRASSNEMVKKNEDNNSNATNNTTPAPHAISAHSGKRAQELSVRVPEARKSKKEMAHKADAGPQWFNLPATDLTPQLRRDLQLLRMRDVLDPKRHYKKDTTRAIPEFSQVGTVMPGPTDYFSARMTKKDRKRTLLQEVLETENATKRFKSKYGEIQATKTSGKKGHYKQMMQKRYGRNYKG